MGLASKLAAAGGMNASGMGMPTHQPVPGVQTGTMSMTNQMSHGMPMGHQMSHGMPMGHQMSHGMPMGQQMSHGMPTQIGQGMPNQMSMTPPQMGMPGQMGMPSFSPSGPASFSQPTTSAGSPGMGYQPGMPGANMTAGHSMSPPSTNPPQMGLNQSGYTNTSAYQKEMSYQQTSTVQGGHMPATGMMGGNSSVILSTLRKAVQNNNLGRFYNENQLQQLAAQLAGIEPKVRAMVSEWNIPMEIANDIYQLALYDIIMLCDDSGSMAFEERGERIADLKMIIGYVARAASLFDADGISVRFLNSSVSQDQVTDMNQVQSLISRVQFSGLTPLGSMLQAKVLEPFYYNAVRSNNFRKPLLTIVITDGVPAGEPVNQLEMVLTQLYNSSNGGEGVAISIAQVGSDQEAQRFLAGLDGKSVFRKMIDVTSNYELEQTELMRKGVNLSPSMWVCKLLLGAIDSSYDNQDE